MASMAACGRSRVDGRLERPGAHAVDPDAVAGVLDRRHLGELDDGGLGGAVGRGVGPGGEPGDRRGEHDRTRPLRAHDRHRGPDAVDGAEHVDPERALPVLGGEVVDAAVGREHAGVADQGVEPAEALDGPGDDGLDLVGVARRRPAASRPRPSTPRARPPTVASSDACADVAQHHVGVGLAGEVAGERGAERAAGPGDGDDSSGHTSRYPPSTLRTAPVTNAEASDARNWYAPARSVACAPAPLGGVPEDRGRPASGCSSTRRPAASRTSRGRRR